MSQAGPFVVPRLAEGSPVVGAVRQRGHPGDRAGSPGMLGYGRSCRRRRELLPVGLPAVVVPVCGFGGPAPLPHTSARVAVRLGRVGNLAVRGV